MQRKTVSKPACQPQGLVIGRAAFEKISAVEGIEPSEASIARSNHFERRGLSADERRREIIAAHCPKATS